jgi:insulysin
MLIRSFERAALALFAVCISLTLASCAGVPQGTGQPLQSPNDDYQYRILTLENDLQVLLISDPDAPKAAASLTVMVGSGDNPPGRGGLAHFLEHMLFLGTDKYPDAAEYEEYITEHGGSRNAYTAFDHTNYFFDVNAEHLTESLDRFAQFFIAPRFDSAYVDREKNAVQAEYQMGLKSDGRRGLDVLQEVMNPEHPYSQFSVGSLETLADRDGSAVRQELLAFYAKYYSANIMRLVVLGSESLDELQTLVTPMFSQIPNNSFRHKLIKAPAFAGDSLPMLVSVKPLATLRQLEVSFPIADYRDKYRTKPLSYLGNIVGHEGEGSLLSQLKSEGLAESLGAGSALGWRGGSMFSIGISLTEKGVAERDRVLQLVFAYLDMLRGKGPRDWLYQEQARLAELSFRFREPGSAMRYVSALSSGMHYYRPQDVLKGPYLMDEYDPAMLAEVLDALSAENALVVFNDQSAITDRISEHYQVPYARAPLDIAAVSLAANDEVRQSLRLPTPNEFVTEDVSLVSLPDVLPKIPSVHSEEGRQKVWYMPDAQYRVPKGVIAVRFRSTEVGETPEQAALAALYTAVLMDAVNEFSYPARLAGLNFGFNAQTRGITLKVSGYNDKQLLLLGRLLEAVHDAEFDPQRFSDIRDDMVRALKNTAAKRPSSQVMNDLEEALRRGKWGEDALIGPLENASLESMGRYIASFWENATAEALLYGNYDAGLADDLSKMLDSVISTAPAPALPAARVLKLGADVSVQYEVAVAHDDSVVAWYLQGAGISWKDKAATALTAQIMKSGFFQQLRTEQQLGYVVSAFNWPQQTIPGLVMLIQSPVADAPAVADAMEAFLAEVPQELSEEQFARHKEALRSEILRPHKNLSERAEFYWSSIAYQRLKFDGRESVAAALDALSYEDWQTYFSEVFLGGGHSLRVVSPGKWGQSPAGAKAVYDSAQKLKQALPSYQLP